VNEKFVLELKKLLNCFPDSYINNNLEVILIPKTNTYFSLKGCSTKRDIVAKVLMWCTRDISKLVLTNTTNEILDFMSKTEND